MSKSKRGNFSSQVVQKENKENPKQQTEDMESKAFASMVKLVEERADINMEDM